MIKLNLLKQSGKFIGKTIATCLTYKAVNEGTEAFKVKTMTERLEEEQSIVTKAQIQQK